MYRRFLMCCVLLAGTWLAFDSGIIPRGGLNSGLSSAQGGFAITGLVTSGTTPGSGPGIPGVTMTLLLRPSTQTTVQTDSNGNFTFTNVPAGSDYEVTPSKTDWTFQPSSQGGIINQDRMLFFTGAMSSPTPTPTPTPTVTPTPTPTPTVTPTPTPTPTVTPTPTPTPAPNSLQFASSASVAIEAPNVTTKVELTVTRVGDSSGLASVSYASSDVTASDRSDYTVAIGTLKFGSGETSKTITVFIVNDSYGESAETFHVTLSNAVGATLGAPSVQTVTINSDESVDGPNPVKNATFNSDFFVRQHYLDFFNREPDAGGLAFWKNQIDECETRPPAEQQPCREIRRINVSAAFFLSIEFQQTGYLVERLYKVAYGSGTGTSTFGGTHQLPVPIVRLNEFLPDTQTIGRGVVIGQPGADQLLEANKQALIAEFVQRARFVAEYPAVMTPAQFVDKLNLNSENALSQGERDQLVAELTSGVKTRAQVVRAVAEDSTLFNSETNRAFVLAQFFGYLRRNANDPQDIDYTGFDFWLTKLNEFNGNFVNAEMVKAFITSGEYLGRFGP